MRMQHSKYAGKVQRNTKSKDNTIKKG